MVKPQRIEQEEVEEKEIHDHREEGMLFKNKMFGHGKTGMKVARNWMQEDGNL